MISEGIAYKQIAFDLGIRVDTVRRHASRIMHKTALERAALLPFVDVPPDLLPELLAALPASDALGTAELTVVAMTCRGLSAKEIARLRNVSPRTIEKQRANAMARLRVRSLLELGTLVRRQYAISGMQIT